MQNIKYQQMCPFDVLPLPWHITLQKVRLHEMHMHVKYQFS